MNDTFYDRKQFVGTSWLEPRVEMNDSFYRDYEDRHRGSRELIKARLRAYAPFLAPLRALQQRPLALDLGCGRGEWLELLGEAGYGASGVDLDEGMLAACRERCLDVERADAVSTLRALPDASLALVSAFHLVEHLPFAELRVLVREALRVLQPGGLLIMETPNPENLVVGATSFYMDPSHVRPLPPPLLAFVVEFCGFLRHKIVRLQEAAPLHTAAPIGLLHVLDGVSPDYAVLAQKSAGSELLSPLDPAFALSRGVELAALATRYDAQNENRLAQVRQGVAQVQARAAHSAQQVERRLARMDERQVQLELRLDAVFSSRSWRITAPLRVAADGISRLRRAVREARIVRAARSGVRAILQGAALALLRQPQLKKAALAVLDRLPGLRHRMYGIVREKAADGVLPAPAGQAPGALSPGARRIHSELKKMIEQGGADAHRD